jgi:hypothetical protein
MIEAKWDNLRRLADKAYLSVDDMARYRLNSKPGVILELIAALENTEQELDQLMFDMMSDP